jgi:hypothetical protein
VLTNQLNHFRKAGGLSQVLAWPPRPGSVASGPREAKSGQGQGVGAGLLVDMLQGEAGITTCSCCAKSTELLSVAFCCT